MQAHTPVHFQISDSQILTHSLPDPLGDNETEGPDERESRTGNLDIASTSTSIPIRTKTRESDSVTMGLKDPMTLLSRLEHCIDEVLENSPCVIHGTAIKNSENACENTRLHLTSAAISSSWGGRGVDGAIPGGT